MMHHKIPYLSEWQEEGVPPFDEFILSWNAMRPTQGQFLFYVSVKLEHWSPWLLYASWGNNKQSSFHTQTSELRVYQDSLEILEGKKATGFQIKISAENCSLSHIYGLHVYTNGDKSKNSQNTSSQNSIRLPIPGLSQMSLNHPRRADLCSPTSTTSVTRYLANNPTIDPVLFAEQVWDAGFNIFGNWVFNVAHASTFFNKEWHCWVERLNGFNDIYNSLVQGAPVIVSVRGPLPGSAQPYAKGHLMAVIGYDSSNKQVLCMDPAFPSDNETDVSYSLSDFMQAWDRRGNVAYVFSKVLN